MDRLDEIGRADVGRCGGFHVGFCFDCWFLFGVWFCWLLAFGFAVVPVGLQLGNADVLELAIETVALFVGPLALEFDFVEERGLRVALLLFVVVLVWSFHRKGSVGSIITAEQVERHAGARAPVGRACRRG